ncbi:hypothetical protein ACHAW5_006059 [Stephanodiscus triporus]|uniref:HMG box domain-containing protein n=1 Tax=Stephanodiscus triporus TaxID=2934178 RepID=A0ABD3QAY2_9STRA
MATPDAAPVGSSDASTRGWALDTANATIRVKPRRPYTPYNLFYLLERELVVQGHDPSMAKEKALEKNGVSSMRGRPEDDIPIPSRYKNVVLSPMWYEPNMKEKRKHRKTHGKISFKDLTAIISQNWATIDAETKQYCTRVSDLGRKLYKETMTQYNASQKIIQLKKERAAMESAREQKLDEQSFMINTFNSPNRPGKSLSNPATPDRIASGRGAKIVTPPHSGFNISPSIIAPIHVPSGAPASFYHYGPPPPMPSSVPHSQSHPHSMPGPSNSLSHSMLNRSQSHPHALSIPGHFPSWIPSYAQQYNQHHHHHQYSYHGAPAMNKTNDSSGANAKTSRNNSHHDRCTGGNITTSPIPYGGLGLNMNVNDSVMKVDGNPAINPDSSSNNLQPSEKGNLTHDDAIRICNLMESPGKRFNQYEVELNNHPIHDMPSFDFADHHSLSSDDGDMNRELSSRDLLGHYESNEDNFLDLGYDDEAMFPDIV